MSSQLSLYEDDPTLKEVLDKYELVEATEHYLLVEEKRPRPLQQLSRGATQYGDELRIDYSNDWRFPQFIDTVTEMRNDAHVRNSLNILKTPVFAGRWFIKPASNDPVDVEIAAYIWDNLTDWISTSWPQMVIESLYMLDYGFYVFEKVFDIVDGLVRWDKFVPIHPSEIVEPLYNTGGGYKGVKIALESGEKEIPISKLLVFTYDQEAGNMFGKSILRSAYKHWFYKENLYKIDAIQKERHGIGVPIIKLPGNHNKTTDVQVAHQIGTDLRTNEQAHVVLPPGWELIFARLEGQPVDALESAKWHGTMIYENVMASFMEARSMEHAEQAQLVFIRRARFVAEIIRDVWNKYAFPQLVAWNWPGRKSPELKIRRLGDTQDWRTISFALRNFVGAKLVTPTKDDEEWIRDEMDLPGFNPQNVRETETPQAPPRIGLPRQSTAAGMQQQARGTGKSNAGEDNSGG